MCTALIYRDVNAGKFGLGFNRDESVKRKPAKGPVLEVKKDITVLAPVDGDYGGTWIGVNSNREIFALLNLYEAELKLLRNPTSRGLLVKSLLFGEIAIGDIEAGYLKQYYPFRLIKVSGEETGIISWDGVQLIHEKNSEDWKVLGSSFTQGPKAEAERKKIFDENFSSLKEKTPFDELSRDFLSSHLPEKGALSPCMHRRDARTVSQTIISVVANSVTMEYKNGQPCEIDGFEISKMSI